MIQYQATPDYYNDYIAHKEHKYISKKLGKNGKWIYIYNIAKKISPMVGVIGEGIKKAKREEKLAKTTATFNKRMSDKKFKSAKWNNYKKSKQWKKDSGYDALDEYFKLNGRPRPRKKVKVPGTSKPQKVNNTNLRDRGYSSSQGSGESKRQRNLGTRHSSRALFNSTKDVVKIGNATYTLDRAGRAKEYNEWRKNPQRTMAKDAILNKRILGKSDKYSANKGYKRGKKKK